MASAAMPAPRPLKPRLPCMRMRARHGSRSSTRRPWGDAARRHLLEDALGEDGLVGAGAGGDRRVEADLVWSRVQALLLRACERAQHAQRRPRPRRWLRQEQRIEANDLLAVVSRVTKFSWSMRTSHFSARGSRSRAREHHRRVALRGRGNQSKIDRRREGASALSALASCAKPLMTVLKLPTSGVGRPLSDEPRIMVVSIEPATRSRGAPRRLDARCLEQVHLRRGASC